MLSKSRRLTADDFKQFPRNAETVHTPVFVMRVAPDAPESYTRFGVVISQKVARTAVARHRLKRRVHGMLESVIHDVADGYAVVFYMKQEAVNTTSEELRRSVTEALITADVLADVLHNASHRVYKG